MVAKNQIYALWFAVVALSLFVLFVVDRRFTDSEDNIQELGKLYCQQNPTDSSHCKIKVSSQSYEWKGN